MRRTSTLALPVLALTVAACSDDVTGPGTQCADDAGSVTVTVSDASSPVLSWDPACGVAMLLVEEDASDRWAISTDEEVWGDPEQANLITPPVTYGVVPPGTVQSEPAAPLTEGVVYEVVLWRALSSGSQAECQQRLENMCLLAVHEFTR